MLLQEFNLEIKDKKGTENLVVDHLFRLEYMVLEEGVHSVINENFLTEPFFSIEEVPWYADSVNYLAK